MDAAALAIGIVSLVLATASLLWNVYRDIILTPRTATTSRISNILHGDHTYGPYIDITIVNKGPGKVILQSIVVRTKSAFATIIGRQRWAVVINDNTNRFNPQMPTTLGVYEKTTQLLPFDEESFVSTHPNRWGFVDTIGKYHWVKRRHCREINREFSRRFVEGVDSGTARG